MEIPTTITADWLRERDACSGHLARFVALFGDAAALTRVNLHRAAAAGLDVDWLAVRVLQGTARVTYLTATDVAWEAWFAVPDRSTTAPEWSAAQRASADAVADILGLP